MFWYIALDQQKGNSHISYDTPGLRSEGYPCGPPTLKTKVGSVPLPKLGMTLIRVPTVWRLHPH